MKKLLYKDLVLGVYPLFYLMPILTGALMLIPAWVYILVPMYFFWITIPNTFANFKANNDLTFSILLPVNKHDIVKARILVIVLLEIWYLLLALPFGIINLHLYKNVYHLFLIPNFAYWGIVFMMLGLFNIVFFPIYFKSAYKYGLATIAATITILVFASVVEYLNIFNQQIRNNLSNDGITTVHMLIFFSGIVIFGIFAIIAYKISIKSFEKVDI